MNRDQLLAIAGQTPDDRLMEAIRPTVSSVLTELSSAAVDAADEVFVLLDSVEHTFANVHREVERTGRGLLASGIRPGDRVLILLPNLIEAVWSWLGVQRVGAIDVPVSVETAGASLAHVVDEVAPRAVIGTESMLKRLSAAGALDGIEIAIEVGQTSLGDPPPNLHHVDFDEMIAAGKDAELPPIPGLGDVATVMFSSGTTGPPKGVMLSHGYYPQTAHAYDGIVSLPARPTVYCTQPLCHIDPRMVLLDVLLRRGRLVLAPKFSASQFWTDVVEHDADAFCFIGAMLHLIYKQPERGDDRGRRRVGMGSAIPADIHGPFSQRFNVDLMEGYGMTELYSMTTQRSSERTSGNVGSELPTVELAVVDEQDQPVADGLVGELVARPRVAHAHMLGYWGRPEATVATWRNLWFHTGDLMRKLPDSTFQYVGRAKDSIRRRGENVSAWEVERAAAKFADVLDAAAVGIPAEIGDEDVALFVVPRPGTQLDPAVLRAAMAEDLPRFALPRFIDIVDSLPKTPSERVAKAVLRERGLSSNAHDLEPARLPTT